MASLNAPQLIGAIDIAGGSARSPSLPAWAAVHDGTALGENRGAVCKIFMITRSPGEGFWIYTPLVMSRFSFHRKHITVASCRARWRPKSPASRIFAQLLVQAQIKKTSKLRTCLCEGNHRWPVNFPNKGPITRKMFLFDDVIMHDAKGSKMPVILKWNNIL